MTRTEAFSEVEIESREALWSWLADHHDSPDSVWLVTWKKAAGGRYVSRDEVLDALLAYGWIDGIRRARDDGRTMQLVSPRRQQAWTESYRSRVARLEAEGRMAAPGRASVERAKQAGTWLANTDVDALVVPQDLAVALGSAGTAFDGFAPSYRRNVLRWIAGAKRPETRRKRIEETVSHTRSGRKIRNF